MTDSVNKRLRWDTWSRIRKDSVSRRPAAPNRCFARSKSTSVQIASRMSIGCPELDEALPVLADCAPLDTHGNVLQLPAHGRPARDRAPDADIHSEARNPVIGPRAYGSEPGVVADHVAHVLRGFGAAGVATCLKHFPGHGDTTTDSHLTLPVNAHPRELLERRELEPF